MEKIKIRNNTTKFEEQTMSFIKLDNIIKRYGEGDSSVLALNDISCSIDKGDSVSIMGTSGSGKSTLLNIIGTIDDATEGKYYINDKNIIDYSLKEKAKLRNDFFGFVVQDFALIPHYTVEKNVILPLEYTNISKKQKKNKAFEILNKMHMYEKRNAYPSQLSGGQKQRVAIARAMINDASVLLCDEPTGSLDSKTSSEIMEIFMKLNEEGRTLIIVTHDKDIACYCKKLIQIEDGKIL